MVLTIEPAWATHSDEPNRSRTAQRLAIRRATLPLLIQRGYDAVTIEDIIGIAGISRRTFFRLFGGKDQLVSCDHEVYHREMHTYLLQHQGQRSIGRAARGAALIVDSLTAVREDSLERAALLASSSALSAEENRWFDRHQTTIASFLTDHTNLRTTIQAEMTAAAIITGARIAMRDYLQHPDISAPTRFKEATASLTRYQSDAIRQVAVVETSLPLDEILARINNP
ncbi:TetR family transcriptional regulator [Pseudarthrobacter sp. NPDC058196]|uniref:TetR family transcriptional regulator n=1 Tax=Pseudarthrobacter sp. NPDC058196 TaxID=3346376 RepID=UPI0036D9120B